MTEDLGYSGYGLSTWELGYPGMLGNAVSQAINSDKVCSEVCSPGGHGGARVALGLGHQHSRKCDAVGWEIV